ncbi:hypothetical protein EHQ75_18290 [Leptospira levettii]|uniref:Lipoprotein n=1 Tax=Leptospira levettii TaxID=2023178 RepID=A0ABY2MPJ3_9LEPT|nr:hypothetical protein [Leptospira levettii]MCW7496738.1 hypothetical protein [Leptospira levettii]TGL71589.1 hypothetical protein EHQ60_08275 [Leptospira levettii]TGM34757.1 hypothetical protein EHQ75_18290 [Leptospira levettii]
MKNKIGTLLCFLFLFLRCSSKNESYLLAVPYIQKEKNNNIAVVSLQEKVLGKSCRISLLSGFPNYNEAINDALKDHPNVNGLLEVDVTEQRIYWDSFVTVFFPRHCLFVEGYPAVLK